MLELTMSKRLFFQLSACAAFGLLLFTACNQNKTSEGTDNAVPVATPPATASTEQAPAEAAPAESPADATDATPDGELTAEAAPADGPESTAVEALYTKANCAMCHGSDLAGGKLGPALTGLAGQGWDPDRLQMYLADPKDHSVNPERLSELEGQYSMAMPAFTGSEEERFQLAEWLLTK